MRTPNLGDAAACSLILVHYSGGDFHWITPAGTRRWIPSTTVDGCIASRGIPRCYPDDRSLLNDGRLGAAHGTC